MSIRLARRTTVLQAILLASSLSAAAQQGDPAGGPTLVERAAGRRLELLQEEAEQLASDERTLLNDLRKLELDRRIKSGELARITAEAAAIATEREQITAQIGQIQHQERLERPGLDARLVELYKLRHGRYLHLLLSASDMRRLGQASRMVAALAIQDQERVERHSQRRIELERRQQTLEQRGQQLDTLRTTAFQAQAAAARAVEAHQELIRQIDQQRDLNARFMGELQEAQSRLQQTLRSLDSSVAAPAAPGPFPQGELDWPANGTLRLPFGQTAVAGRPSSNGVEIAAEEGTAVHAVHPGTVAFAGTFAGFGNLVIIDHGRRAFSLYGNLLDVGTEKGARIERGQPIGTVGSPPARPSGLYFELRVDGQPVDPLQWLKRH